MKNQHFTLIFSIVILTFAMATAAQSQAEFAWKQITINADSKFEACGVGDINRDGKADIVCGNFWYEAPDFKPHRIADMKPQNEYYNDFANEIFDVDHDGDPDIVSCTWFSKEIYWRENPGQMGAEWKKHTIDTPGNMETGFFYDINGDSAPDFFPDLARDVAWFEKTPGKAEWTKHQVGKEGAGHGHGVGDINMDGVTDIVCPQGWYKGSKKGKSLEFSWIPFENLVLERASFPILVEDINQDGRNDIIWGNGHGYGVFWLEQSKNGNAIAWKKHEIDSSWSQAHYLAYLDLNDDGKKELVTGKRVRAHNGKDPGGNEAPCVYIYQYNPTKKQWHRQTVTQDEGIGFGLNPAIADIDTDGDLDLVCPGKSGLYLLIQQ